MEIQICGFCRAARPAGWVERFWSDGGLKDRTPACRNCGEKYAPKSTTQIEECEEPMGGTANSYFEEFAGRRGLRKYTTNRFRKTCFQCDEEADGLLDEVHPESGLESGPYPCCRKCAGCDATAPQTGDEDWVDDYYQSQFTLWENLPEWKRKRFDRHFKIKRWRRR